MNPSDSHQESEPPVSDVDASPLTFWERLSRRVKYMVLGCCFCGAYLGRVNGLPGVVVGVAAGAVIGLCMGLVIGGYAWFLESPLKAAIRVGGLFGVTTGPFSLIRHLSKHGWGDLETTSIIALIVTGMATVVGALLGAFIAWLGGPIFREIIQEADQGDSPLKRRPWW